VTDEVVNLLKDHKQIRTSDLIEWATYYRERHPSLLSQFTTTISEFLDALSRFCAFHKVGSGFGARTVGRRLVAAHRRVARTTTTPIQIPKDGASASGKSRHWRSGMRSCRVRWNPQFAALSQRGFCSRAKWPRGQATLLRSPHAKRLPRQRLRCMPGSSAARRCKSSTQPDGGEGLAMTQGLSPQGRSEEASSKCASR